MTELNKTIIHFLCIYSIHTRKESNTKLSSIAFVTFAAFGSFSSAAPLIGALVAPLALEVVSSTGPGKEILGTLTNTAGGILGSVLGKGSGKEEQPAPPSEPQQTVQTPPAVDPSSTGTTQQAPPKKIFKIIPVGDGTFRLAPLDA